MSECLTVHSSPGKQIEIACASKFVVKFLRSSLHAYVKKKKTFLDTKSPVIYLMTQLIDLIIDGVKLLTS